MQDLDDEFMNISSDAGSASGNDDGDTASGDESQRNIVEEADDSLSDAEASDHDGSVPVGWMSQSTVSREQLPFFHWRHRCQSGFGKPPEPTGHIFGFCR